MALSAKTRESSFPIVFRPAADILLGSETGGSNVAGRQAMTRSSTKAGVLSSVLGVLVFAGCATMRRPPSAAPGFAQPAVPVVKLPATPPTAPSGKAPSVPEQMMLVESVPPGAIIVVAGRPVGKAPLRLAVPATAQGFFLNDVEIRARFVATDATGVSRTATEEFTPREKVPVALHFTPEGAQRAAR